jgi:hypothetical protein
MNEYHRNNRTHTTLKDILSQEAGHDFYINGAGLSFRQWIASKRHNLDKYLFNLFMSSVMTADTAKHGFLHDSDYSAFIRLQTTSRQRGQAKTSVHQYLTHMISRLCGKREAVQPLSGADSWVEDATSRITGLSECNSLFKPGQLEIWLYKLKH